MVSERISLKDVNLALNGQIVGGAEELTITIAAEDEPAHEGGSYLPVEIVDGKITITGSMTRAFLDIDLINQVMPNTGLKSSFTLSGIGNNSKTPNRNIRVFGVKFSSIDINSFGLDGYARNALPFNATNWMFDD